MSLALITGRGALPGAVAQAQAVAPLICALDGHVPDGLQPDLSFRVERLGGLLHQLRKRGVTELCLVGAIDRPRLSPLRLDARTVPLLPLLRRAVAGGEDSALRAVVAVLEEKGFVLRGAHELAPRLLPQPGVRTQTQPSDTLEASHAAAQAVLQDQAARDQGQACVIRAGQVIAREGGQGTDAMLRGLLATAPQPMPMADADDPFGQAMDMVGDMLGATADWLSGPEAEATHSTAKGGVFYKAPKPGQDLRVDMPTVGPATAQGVIDAGLDGMVLAAGGVLVLEQAQVVDMLDAAGVFLWVR